MSNQKAAILFLIFRRADIAMASFEPIRQYKPNRLYIAADGGRAHKVGEKELCEQTRQAVLNLIDWDCEIKTLFRDENLGCAKAVSGAIDWFFETEEQGIIVEDDCVLHPDFFKLSEELLPYYAKNEQIMQICAHNPAGSKVWSNEYYFGRNAYIWGWATWKRAWKKMDMQMSQWPNTSLFELIEKYTLFEACFRYYYWQKAYTHINTSQSWATRWNFSVLKNNGLCISPKANMAVNTGIGNEGGTHYSDMTNDPYINLNYGNLIFPLNYPPDIKFSPKKIAQDRKEFKRLRFFGLKQKIKNLQS